MSIRDCSNLPDHLIPQWVLLSRERSREIDRRRLEFLKEWEKEKPKWTALVKANKEYNL